MSQKEGFYSLLNMNDMTDGDACTEKEFVNILSEYHGECHDLHIQSDSLITAT